MAMSESVVPLIICEGKTDWKHLKAAYRRLKAAGLFPQLDMEFLEFEEDVQMGDAELLRICRTYSKTPRDKPILCLFDRDNQAVLRQVVGEGVDYRAWGNEVYSFALPIPPCRAITPEISIELLYSDEEIRLKDSKGRRLFLNSEFHRESGLHHSRDVHCLALNKIRRSALSITDDEVFDRNSQNVALSTVHSLIFLLAFQILICKLTKHLSRNSADIELPSKLL
jgi:hypothetical protein